MKNSYISDFSLNKFFIIILTSILLVSCSTSRFIVYVPEKQPEPVKIKKRPRVAVVLGGGGSKGIAHLGILEELEKNKIPVDLIVGSSAGSIIGGFYADNPKASHLRDTLINLTTSDLIENIAFSYYSIPVIFSGPVEGNKFRKFIYENIKAKDFSQLKIPFIVVTTDISTGERYQIRGGPIAPAIHASSSVPLIFRPVQMYGRTLTDGGVAAPVPVLIAKEYDPEIIVAVNITSPPDKKEIESTYDIFRKTYEISYYELSKIEADLADVVIEPELHDVFMFNDTNNTRVFEEGRLAGQRAMKKIKSLMVKKGIGFKK